MAARQSGTDNIIRKGYYRLSGYCHIYKHSSNKIHRICDYSGYEVKYKQHRKDVRDWASAINRKRGIISAIINQNSTERGGQKVGNKCYVLACPLYLSVCRKRRRRGRRMNSLGGLKSAPDRHRKEMGEGVGAGSFGTSKFLRELVRR